jgi:hypothetical protein
MDSREWLEALIAPLLNGRVAPRGGKVLIKGKKKCRQLFWKQFLIIIFSFGMSRRDSPAI